MTLLHQRYPALSGSLGHVSLGERPTPVRGLPGLSEGAAPVWLKDDGRFGAGAWGGNKVRKLEWLLPEVRRRRRRTILTVGGLGTNWGLVTALYGREQGLRTALALVDQPVDDHVRAHLERLRASGATLHFMHTKARLVAALPWLLVRHRRPYLLGAGGSSPVGALGYVEASLELAEQIAAGDVPEPTHVVVPVGSGGTVAGLALGLALAGLRTRAVGVVVNDQLRLDEPTLTRLARRAARLLRKRGADLPPLEPEVAVVRDWIGPGYGHSTPEAARAAELAAAREGLTLDPVYTAKAVAGLLEMNAAGRFGAGPVLYLHTDGPRC